MATLESWVPAETGADPMRPTVWHVLRAARETHNTFTIALAPPHGAPNYSFAPGQFNMLYAFGVGEVPISMSGTSGRVHEVVHTIRSVGTVTRALERLKRGHAVGLRGPFGTAWPVADAEGGDIVLVAGGIGLAPLRPALYHVLAHREQYGRVVLLFGARSPKDVLFQKELEGWRGRLDLDVDVTVDRGGADWRGSVGVVTTLFSRVHFDPAHTTAFVCGPEIMMTFCVRELRRRGVPAETIHVSLERSMKCAVGLCGHCQLGPLFVCRDGPVFRWDRVERLLSVREI
jgi:NAD(P)H-flavin reductase